MATEAKKVPESPKTADEILKALANKGGGADKKQAASEVATALGADPKKKEDVGKACTEAKKTLTEAKDTLAAKKDPNDDKKLNEFDDAITKIDKTNNEINPPASEKKAEASKGGAGQTKEHGSPKAFGSILEALMALVPSLNKYLDRLEDKIMGTQTYKDTKKAWNDFSLVGSLKKLLKGDDKTTTKSNAVDPTAKPAAANQAAQTADAAQPPLNQATDSTTTPDLKTAAEPAKSAATNLDETVKADEVAAKANEPVANAETTAPPKLGSGTDE